MSNAKLYKVLRAIVLVSWLAFFGLIALNFKTGDESWWIALACLVACVTTIMLSKLKSGYY